MRESWWWFAGFGYLQVLDLLTTIAFLLKGVAEANPLVRWTFSAAGDPLYGLLYAKLVALVLGFACWKWSRRGLLSKATVAYSLLVVWNLAALTLAGFGVR
jgi:hypothetical protein